MARNYDRTLEELLDGPLTDVVDAPDAVADQAETDVIADPESGVDEANPVDEVGLADAQTEAVEGAATVERALQFARQTMEHANALALLMNQLGREADGENQLKAFGAKAGAAIAKAWDKLVQFVQTWVGKAVNFFRAGGLEKKLGEISQGIKASDEKVKALKVPNPADVEAILAKFGGALGTDNGFTVLKGTLKGEQKSLSEVLAKALDVATKASFDKFRTGGAKLITDAKKKQAAALKSVKGEDRKPGNEELADLNAGSLLLVRGFGWYVSIVNKLVQATKLSVVPIPAK